MIYGSFVDIGKIAEEAGCDAEAAYTVAVRVLEGLHKTLLLNGVTGSLQEAMMHIDREAAYHLGGIYTAIGDDHPESETGFYVTETLRRLSLPEEWKPFYEKMDAWEKTLTEEQQALIRQGREIHK